MGFFFISTYNYSYVARVAKRSKQCQQKSEAMRISQSSAADLYKMLAILYIFEAEWVRLSSAGKFPASVSYLISKISNNDW